MNANNNFPILRIELLTRPEWFRRIGYSTGSFWYNNPTDPVQIDAFKQSEKKKHPQHFMLIEWMNAQKIFLRCRTKHELMDPIPIQIDELGKGNPMIKRLDYKINFIIFSDSKLTKRSTGFFFFYLHFVNICPARGELYGYVFQKNFVFLSG